MRGMQFRMFMVWKKWIQGIELARKQNKLTFHFCPLVHSERKFVSDRTAANTSSGSASAPARAPQDEVSAARGELTGTKPMLGLCKEIRGHKNESSSVSVAARFVTASCGGGGGEGGNFPTLFIYAQQEASFLRTIWGPCPSSVE